MPTWKTLKKIPRPRIEVTQEIIDEAKRQTSGHCMIADAIKAHPTLNASRVSVDLATIRWTDIAKGQRITYMTPRSAQLRLIMFEGGITPRPFDFALTGPAHIRDVSIDNAKAKDWRDKRRAKIAQTPVPAQPSAQQSLPGIDGPKPKRHLVQYDSPRRVPVVRGGPGIPQMRGMRREFGLRAMVGDEKKTMGENWEEAIRRAAANPKEIGRTVKAKRARV